MKKQFQRYYFLVVVLLITVFNCFSHQLYSVQLGSENTEVVFSSFHSIENTLEQNDFTKASDKFLYKDTVNHTFVDHSKGNISETEFEVNLTFKFKGIDALLKFNTWRCISSAVVDFHSRKSALILSNLSLSYTSLNDALYLKFEVIRL